MQTCSLCHASNNDSALKCSGCQADLKEFSVTAVALKTLRENPRVRAIRVAVYDSSCPVCRQMFGTYTKETVPTLPIEGCSHSDGCRCFYEPVLNEMYP